MKGFEPLRINSIDPKSITSTIPPHQRRLKGIEPLFLTSQTSTLPLSYSTIIKQPLIRNKNPNAKGINFNQLKDISWS